MSDKRIALITGGASGMGLEVAKSLLSDAWTVYILDMNETNGQAVVKQNPGLHFLSVDVTSWPSLSSSFDKVFRAEGSIDFVFANAGILDLQNFYHKDEALPPAEPNQRSIDINLNAAINTVHLARHYLLASGHPAEKPPSIVVTASIASFYVQEFNPLYSASKAGILSFVRSVASQYWSEGIRINAICPGSVRTPLVSGKVWDLFPQEYMTPVETIVSTVRMLIDGGDITDSEGCTVTAGNVYGLAVEIFVRDIFFRVQAPYISEAMRQICEAASVKNQKGNLKD